MRIARSDHRLSAVIAGILLVLTVIVPAAVRAEVKEIKEISPKPLALLESIRKRDDTLPSNLPTDRDAFLVIYARATVFDVYLLGRASVDPAKLARTLEKAVVGTQLQGKTVGYMQGKRYSWADVWLETHRVGLDRAEMRCPVGLIMSRLTKSGLRLHTVLQVSSVGNPPSDLRSWMRKSKSGRTLAGVVSPNRTDLEFTLRTELGRWDSLRLILLVFGCTLLCIVAIPVVAKIVAATNSTPRGRTAAFAMNYRLASVTIMLITGYATLAYLRSPRFWMIGDLWFGATAYALMLPLLLPALFLLSGGWIARRLFDPSGSQTDSSKGMRTGAPSLVLFIIVSSFAYTMAKHGASPNSLFAHYGSVLLYLYIALFGAIAARIAALWSPMRGRRTSNPELLSRFHRLSTEMGVRLIDVLIVDNGKPQRPRRVAACGSGGVLLLTRWLVDRLTPEELEFIAACEFARKARSYSTRGAGMLLFSLIMLIPATVALSVGPMHPLLTDWVFWVAVAGFVLFVYDGTYGALRRRDEVDQLALKSIRDPQLAARAIMRASGLPDGSGSEEAPKPGGFDMTAMSRLWRMKKLADRAGIPSASAFGASAPDDSLTMRAQILAKRMGLKEEPRAVEVVELPAGTPLVNAAVYVRGKIVLGRTLKESFTPEEIDFVLGHELAHLRCRHHLRMWLTTAICIIAPLFAVVAMLVPHSSLRSYVPSVACAFLLAQGIPWLARRRESQADRVALFATRDLASALSALGKLEKGNPKTPDEMESLATHPLIRLRAKSLRRYAAKLGIDEPTPQSVGREE